MQRECLLHFSLIKGTRLPSTDFLSKIDAYVKVKVNGAVVGQTHVVSDKSDPVWNRDFFPTMPLGGNRAPAGLITFELWDTFKDDLVGTAVLDLGQLDPSALSYLELPLSFEKPKHAAAGGQARLVLGVRGWVNSFGTPLTDTKHIPGALFNPVDRRAYLPLPCPHLPLGSVYIAVEYEKDAVDIKLFLTVPNLALHADIFLLGRAVSKVRRRVFHGGMPVLPGLVAFEEVKMDDIPLGTDWRQLCVVLFDKQLLWTGNSDAVVSAHGWRGAMNFDDACRSLHGVDIDRSEREIYMPIGSGGTDPATGLSTPPEALLLVDFDNSNVGLLLSCLPDIKLAVVEHPGALDKAWDLTLTAGQQVEKTSQVFLPGRACAGGRWRVTHL